MTIINNQSVVQSSDDADELESTGVVVLTNIYVRQYSHTVAAGRYWAGFRWTTAIPKGSTIVVAHVRFNLYNQTYDDANINLHFEKLASPATFTTGAADITGRARTTASAPWVADGVAAGGVGWFNSPSLVTPLQEVVTDYATTAIALIVRPNTDVAKSLFCYSWDFTGNASGAQLYVEYTPPSSGARGYAPFSRRMFWW